MILLQTFLEQLNKKKQLPDKSVIVFFGKEYPLLFFSHFISFLFRHTITINFFDVTGVDMSIVKAHMSTMSFCGATIYWINNIQELSPKKQKEWIDYVQSYEGPHVLLFFTHDESVSQLNKHNNVICVNVPEYIPAQEFTLMRFLIQDDIVEKTAFSSKISSYTSQISPDNACLLVHYEVVVGKSADDFLKKWGSRIFEPTHSLFLLSQYFFGKKTKLFFEQWTCSSELYMPTFWVTYWADQLWRAYMYCELMQQKKYADAKKVQYKLPFSLINRDWSSLSLDELQQAHHFLTTMDFRIKNGGSPVALELFFNKFFENQFR